ncbi:MAG: hypothetical protein PHI44_02655 [Candidatus Ratteibacteria bacterium]|nr:hypothetical protein [Candidatus Ratteibacteria bacterium]
MVRIDAKQMHYKILNEKIKELVKNEHKEIFIKGVCGQRYIGAGLQNREVRITVEGIPGNDLGIFMDGPEIIVKDDAQDGVGNTMNSGRIVIYGNAGDIVGHSMRGGEIFIKGDVGYRVGIHMKEYRTMYPVIVIGRNTGDFLGEYMAGGMIIVLGMTGRKYVGDYLGTGMHGGVIYVRGNSPLKARLGKEVKAFAADGRDIEKITPYLTAFVSYFRMNRDEVFKGPFYKILPITHRPYGKIYGY